MNSKTKLILIIILGLLFIFPLGVRSYADENSDIEVIEASADRIYRDIEEIISIRRK